MLARAAMTLFDQPPAKQQKGSVTRMLQIASVKRATVTTELTATGHEHIKQLSTGASKKNGIMNKEVAANPTQGIIRKMW